MFVPNNTITVIAHNNKIQKHKDKTKHKVQNKVVRYFQTNILTNYLFFE